MSSCVTARGIPPVTWEALALLSGGGGGGNPYPGERGYPISLSCPGGGVTPILARGVTLSQLRGNPYPGQGCAPIMAGGV